MFIANWIGSKTMNEWEFYVGGRLLLECEQKKTRMSRLNNIDKRETSLSLSLSIVDYVRIVVFHLNYSSYTGNERYDK
jgi:hypothetical protein